MERCLVFPKKKQMHFIKADLCNQQFERHYASLV